MLKLDERFLGNEACRHRIATHEIHTVETGYLKKEGSTLGFLEGGVRGGRVSPAAPRSLRRADALCPLFLLFPVSLDAGGRQENKPDLKAALFNRRWSEAYVSPFKTARQFCSSWRLPFACFSSSSASSTKFFLKAATLLVLKSISSCFADSDIFSNF